LERELSTAHSTEVLNQHEVLPSGKGRVADDPGVGKSVEFFTQMTRRFAETCRPMLPVTWEEYLWGTKLVAARNMPRGS
jgi:hypothetical protein